MPVRRIMIQCATPVRDNCRCPGISSEEHRPQRGQRHRKSSKKRSRAGTIGSARRRCRQYEIHLGNLGSRGLLRQSSGWRLVYVGVGSIDLCVHHYLATSETPTGETLRLLYLGRGERNGRQNGEGFVTEVAPCVLLGVGIGVVTHRLKVPLVACALLIAALGFIPLEVTCVNMFPTRALDGPRHSRQKWSTWSHVFITLVLLVRMRAWQIIDELFAGKYWHARATVGSELDVPRKNGPAIRLAG